MEPRVTDVGAMPAREVNSGRVFVGVLAGRADRR